jgi:hypothetical protein
MLLSTRTSCIGATRRTRGRSGNSTLRMKQHCRLASVLRWIRIGTLRGRTWRCQPRKMEIGCLRILRLADVPTGRRSSDPLKRSQLMPVNLIHYKCCPTVIGLSQRKRKESRWPLLLRMMLSMISPILTTYPSLKSRFSLQALTILARTNSSTSTELLNPRSRMKNS